MPDRPSPEDLGEICEEAGGEELLGGNLSLNWASHGLPDPRPDPYERGLTAARVDAIARSNGR
jgi:hypothetical protein